jgi:hypothetical protein
VSRLRRSLALYAQIGRTYVSWAKVLLPLAFFVFVPLGLVHVVPIHEDLGSLDVSGGFKVFGLVLGLLVLGATGLIGEVFYTGAVSIALTHPHDGNPPTLREVARMISYARLIAVDLIYGALVAVGFAFLIVPGVLIYIYLGLAAPVVEIEGRRVGDGFTRSLRLVRGHFWLVFSVLVPIEVIGDGLTREITELTGHLLGGSLLAEWLADTGSNIVLTPFYAVAVVLLTLDLIDSEDGLAPRLHSTPGSPSGSR